jgi:hypothetical protein
MLAESRKKRMENWYRIYAELYENPFSSVHTIARKTGISHITVYRYLRDMRQYNILKGPYLQMKSLSNYQEYMYLLNFSDPIIVFDWLKHIPHVLYHALTLGKWNTLIITDLPIDFSRLCRFEDSHFSGLKLKAETPKIQFVSWESWVNWIDKVNQYDGAPIPNSRESSFLSWGKEEWELYHAFKTNLRKKVMPVLERLGISYEVYTDWKKSIDEYCTVLLGFFPENPANSMVHTFLISGDNKDFLTHFCSHFPVTPVLYDLGECILVGIHVHSANELKEVFSLFNALKENEIIQDLKYAAIVKGFQH